jgi:hypothetical protein
MSKQWLGRVSVALSLVRAIYSYRRSQLPQRLRALQLLTWILWLRRQMFHPSPPGAPRRGLLVARCSALP